MDISKLKTCFVHRAAQCVDGSVRELASYDAEAGPVLYRAHAEIYDEQLTIRVWFSSYPIVRYTPCGVWIGRGIMKDKFVNLKAEKQWACTTRERAMVHLTHRKRRYVEILNSKLHYAELVLDHLKG